MTQYDKTLKEDINKLANFLEWTLDEIDMAFKHTGKIGFAEMIIYKSAKDFLKEVKARHAVEGKTQWK